MRTSAQVIGQGRGGTKGVDLYNNPLDVCMGFLSDHAVASVSFISNPLAMSANNLASSGQYQPQRLEMHTICLLIYRPSNFRHLDKVCIFLLIP